MSEAERRREDERVDNIVREYERQRLAGPAGRRGQAASRAPGSVTIEMPPVGDGRVSRLSPNV